MDSPRRIAVLLGILLFVSRVFGALFLLNAPIAFVELLPAFVLIVRGFNSASIQFTSDKNGGLQ